MNEILYRSPFNQMKTPEKLMLMKELAARAVVWEKFIFRKMNREALLCQARLTLHSAKLLLWLRCRLWQMTQPLEFVLLRGILS